LTAGIATKYNKKSYKALLNIFGIQTVDGGGGIIIAKKESLKKAAELPLFRYADSRLFRLKEAISMIAAMKHSKVSTEERKKILEHYREGLKANQIVPLLWAELGTARRSGTIQKVIDDSRIQ
jgi:fatty acid-binding protein DegV